MLGPLDALDVDALLEHLPQRGHFSQSGKKEQQTLKTRSDSSNQTLFGSFMTEVQKYSQLNDNCRGTKNAVRRFQLKQLRRTRFTEKFSIEQEIF